LGRSRQVEFSAPAKCCGTAFGKEGSRPSFAAQSANGRNAENRLFAAVVANVSVAGQSVNLLRVSQWQLA